MNYEDCHPKKGYVNWWESEIGNSGEKNTERQKAKKEILKEIENVL